MEPAVRIRTPTLCELADIAYARFDGLKRKDRLPFSVPPGAWTTYDFKQALQLAVGLELAARALPIDDAMGAIRVNSGRFSDFLSRPLGAPDYYLAFFFAVEDRGSLLIHPDAGELEHIVKCFEKHREALAVLDPPGNETSVILINVAGIARRLKARAIILGIISEMSGWPVPQSKAPGAIDLDLCDE